mgnify:CR=1 FL=1
MDEKVLLVDDEQDFLDTLAERMRNRDMQVTTRPRRSTPFIKPPPKILT